MSAEGHRRGPDLSPPVMGDKVRVCVRSGQACSGLRWLHIADAPGRKVKGRWVVIRVSDGPVELGTSWVS